MSKKPIEWDETSETKRRVRLMVTKPSDVFAALPGITIGGMTHPGFYHTTAAGCRNATTEDLRKACEAAGVEVGSAEVSRSRLLADCCEAAGWTGRIADLPGAIKALSDEERRQSIHISGLEAQIGSLKASLAARDDLHRWIREAHDALEIAGIDDWADDYSDIADRIVRLAKQRDRAEADAGPNRALRESRDRYLSTLVAANDALSEADIPSSTVDSSDTADRIKKLAAERDEAKRERNAAEAKCSRMQAEMRELGRGYTADLRQRCVDALRDIAGLDEHEGCSLSALVDKAIATNAEEYAEAREGDVAAIRLLGDICKRLT
jgi:hypothetical protein